MQIAGSMCFICNGHIGTAREAVGCPTCEVFAHESCIQVQTCPRCGSALIRGNELHVRPSLENPANEAGLGPWFPVATHKFIVLSVCSFGIYALYWFYQNWKRVRNASRDGLNPFWRTFFAPIYVIPLLRRIRQSAEAIGSPVGWSAEALGVLFIVLTVCWRLPDPWLLVSLGSFVAFVPAVRTCQQVNEVAKNPEGDNSKYSTSNLITIVLGGLLLVFSVVETVKPN